jgi:tRNA (guanine37-N1)-methyltransferase
MEFIEVAYRALKTGGIINYYEICDVTTLEERMESFREIGLELVYKRIVHGFSKYQNMYSMEFKKIL